MSREDYDEEEYELGLALRESARKGGEIDAIKRGEKYIMDKAKYRAAERLDGMADKVMDALEMALQSEDEAIRLKAALALADRLVPKVGVFKEEKEQVVEVVPDSRKRLLDDVEEEWKKQMKRAEEED